MRLLIGCGLMLASASFLMVRSVDEQHAELPKPDRQANHEQPQPV